MALVNLSTMADPHNVAEGTNQSAVKHATPPHGPPPQPASLQADFRALVEYLLDQKPENGDTSLIAAVGNPHVVRLLLEQRADPNEARWWSDEAEEDDSGGYREDDGLTALYAAARNGQVDVARLLLGHNADPNKAKANYTDDDSTPLYIAAWCGHVDVARLLLGHNADPNTARTDDGTSPLYIASQEGHLDVVQLLLDRNADPNTAAVWVDLYTHRPGATPLYIAANNGRVKIAQLLLGRNADPNTTTYDGTTPLFMASQRGRVKIAQLLLDRNADPNCRSPVRESQAQPNNMAETDTSYQDRCTPLYIASEHGHVEVVRLLLDRNADPNAARISGSNTYTANTDNGATPLYIASQKGHTHVAQLLAVHGASLTIATSNGRTAYDVASRYGRQQLAEWLAAAADHAPIQIAVGCRRHADARSALRTGALGDPTTCMLKSVLQATTSTPMWGAGVAMLPVCRATTLFARDAMACWSPKRHWLFHARFRAAVHAMLLVRHRLAQDAALLLPHMPLELWFSVCAQLLRRCWVV